MPRSFVLERLAMGWMARLSVLLLLSLLYLFLDGRLSFLPSRASAISKGLLGQRTCGRCPQISGRLGGFSRRISSRHSHKKDRWNPHRCCSGFAGTRVLAKWAKPWHFIRNRFHAQDGAFSGRMDCFGVGSGSILWNPNRTKHLGDGNWIFDIRLK